MSIVQGQNGLCQFQGPFYIDFNTGKYFGVVFRIFGEKKSFRPKKYDEIRRFDGVSVEYANLFQTVCIKVTDENQKHFLTVIDINLSIRLCSSRYMAIAARSPGPSFIKWM